MIDEEKVLCSTYGEKWINWAVVLRILEQRTQEWDFQTFWRTVGHTHCWGSWGHSLLVQKGYLVIHSKLEWKMIFGDETTEKKRHDYEYIEIYHLLVPESFKDKLWINSALCFNTWSLLFRTGIFQGKAWRWKGERTLTVFLKKTHTHLLNIADVYYAKPTLSKEEMWLILI